MTGNEVPHRTPASMVKKTALLFLVNSGLGKPLVSPRFPHRQAT
jgi:hypothetical protein